jgi:hypothetical protein
MTSIPDKPLPKMMINKDSGEITVISDEGPPDGWIPEGWIPVGPNRFVPAWPACHHRRLDVLVKKNEPPDITVKCTESSLTKDEELGVLVVDHQTCAACPLFQARQSMPEKLPTDPEMMRSLMARDFPQIVEAPTDTFTETIYLSHPLAGYTTGELDEIEAGSFNNHMQDVPSRKPNKYHPRLRRKSHMKFGTLCLDRIKVEVDKDDPADCAGCGTHKLICNNKNADAFGKKVTRKICTGCPCPTTESS